MAQPTPAAGHSLPQPLPFSPSSLPPLPSLSSSASASDSPPPSSKQLSFGIGTTALSPLLSFHPPSAWQLDATDTAVWHLVNATSGASVVHAFAGSEWALRGTVQKLVTAGGGGGGPLSTEGALNVDNSVRQATATRDDGDIVAAEGLGEGWHRAIWDLPPGFKGAMSVYGAMGRVNVITDAESEAAFAAREQRVPLADHATPAARGNMAYSGEWSVEDSASGAANSSSLIGNVGTMVVSVPANASLFALSGARGEGYGRFEMAFTPPILGMRDFAAETDLEGVKGHESQLFAAPLDPQTLYTVNITSRGARLSALHYWPVNENAFSDWRQTDWSPSTSLLDVPVPSSTPSAAPSSQSKQGGGVSTAAIIGSTFGGVVLVVILTSILMCKCRHWRLLSHRYRPRRSLSKRGISSADVNAEASAERRYTTVASSGSHDGHTMFSPIGYMYNQNQQYSPTPGQGRGTPYHHHPGSRDTTNLDAYSPDPNSSVVEGMRSVDNLRSLTPSAMASRRVVSGHSGSHQSSYQSPSPAPSSVHWHAASHRGATLSSPSPYSSPILGSHLGATRDYYPSAAAGIMYARPTLAESASVVDLPRPPPIPAAEEAPRRPSYEQRVLEFMGIPETEKQGQRQRQRQPGEAGRERVRSPVPPPRARMPVFHHPSPAPPPRDWERDDAVSLISVGTVGKAI